MTGIYILWGISLFYRAISVIQSDDEKRKNWAEGSTYWILVAILSLMILRW